MADSGWGDTLPTVFDWVAGEFAPYVRTAELVAGCHEDYLSLRPACHLGQESLATHRAFDREVLERGVRMRTIVLEGVRKDKATVEYLREQIDAGGQVRTLPTIPAWLQIFDRRAAMVSVGGAGDGPSAIVTSCDALVASFSTLFAKLWLEAEPLKRERRPRSSGLSAMERHILKLWAQGHTDASAARRMDVSIRTVRRLSDRLTARLGARSRFQLGATAIAQRLIDLDDTK